MKSVRILSLVLLVSVLTACSGQSASPTPVPTPEIAATSAGPRPLTVLTHGSFAVSENLVAVLWSNFAPLHCAVL